MDRRLHPTLAACALGGLALSVLAACGDGGPSSPTALATSLVSPAANATLDNACHGGRGRLVWRFEWSDVPGTTAYHLQVAGPSGNRIDLDNLVGSSHRHQVEGVAIPDADRTGWRWRVRARSGGSWGPWSDERPFAVEATGTDCLPPQLMDPASDAVLDNGCQDFSDPVVWDFDWSDVPDATRYHLYVVGGSATIPAIDRSDLTVSSHHRELTAYIADQNRFAWTWRVRALVEDEWTDWSPTRTFSAERLGTDCR